jgi:hypothetical protein
MRGGCCARFWCAGGIWNLPGGICRVEVACALVCRAGSATQAGNCTGCVTENLEEDGKAAGLGGLFLLLRVRLLLLLLLLHAHLLQLLEHLLRRLDLSWLAPRRLIRLTLRGRSRLRPWRLRHTVLVRT